jgi:hypothetical protein
VRSLSSLSFSRLTLVSVTRSRYQAGRTANMKKNSYKDFIPPSIEFGNTAAEVLRYELYVERIEAKGEGREFYQEKPLRHLLQDLKNALERLDEKHDVVEIAILDREYKRVKSSIEPLDKVADRLRIENAQLDKAFNGSSACYPLLSLSLTTFRCCYSSSVVLCSTSGYLRRRARPGRWREEVEGFRGGDGVVARGRAYVPFPTSAFN